MSIYPHRDNEKKFALKEILTRLLARADSEPLHYINTKLHNGLILRVMREPKMYLLVLERPDSMPSDKEWQTVIAHWPYTASVGAPNVREDMRQLSNRVPLPTQQSFFNTPPTGDEPDAQTAPAI